MAVASLAAFFCTRAAAQSYTFSNVAAIYSNSGIAVDAGGTVYGSGFYSVLIRAVGPTLGTAPFNVGGTLAEPQLEIYNGRNFLHASAGVWGLQLLPGAWTVQVGGPGASTGVVLVEVYALP